MIEIKLDKNTLPNDGEWCVYNDDDRQNIVGQFSVEENAFIEPHRLPQSAFYVNFWDHLKIDWHFKEWSEKKENLAIIEGEDDYGNSFEAIAFYYAGEIEQVTDIEILSEPDASDKQNETK